jgi:AMP deaminase
VFFAYIVTCCYFLILVYASETPSHDEIEAYKVLQKCLELREKYIFREEVAPWEKEIITDPSTPKPNPNPFNYEHQTKTEVSTFLYVCA